MTLDLNYDATYHRTTFKMLIPPNRNISKQQLNRTKVLNDFPAMIICLFLRPEAFRKTMHEFVSRLH